MKVCTFNIRRNMDKGLMSFDNRLPLIESFIKSQDFDVVAFQEVMPQMYKKLRLTFSGYEFVGTGRMADLSDEAVPIMYKKGKYNCIFSETFWLSETPLVPGSKYEGMGWPRICTHVTLKDNNGREINWYNTHLDNVSEYSKTEGIKIILRKIREDEAFEKLPVIIMGDFNSGPGDTVPELIKSFKTPVFTDLTGSLDATSHGYGTIAEKIDYIFIGESLTGKPAQMKKVIENGIYISDHWPVFTEISF